MRSFWLKFNERPAGCVEALNKEAAITVAKQITGFDATSADILPYPARPRINEYDDPKHGVCPSFCYKPEQCHGKTCCPQRYSCVD